MNITTSSLIQTLLDKSLSISQENIHMTSMAILNNKGFLKVSGNDCQTLLNGQFTNNVKTLNELTHQLNAACSSKGRLYSTFRLLKEQNNCWLLMNKELCEYTKNTLKRYAMFFKSTIQIEDEMTAIGLSGPDIESTLTKIFNILPQKNNATVLQDRTWLINTSIISDIYPRFELWLPIRNLHSLINKLLPQCNLLQDKYWDLLDIKSVQVNLTKEHIDKFIPQQLNLTSIGAVSFKKGCYTGQEIIARMQNLGQVKSRVYRISINKKVDLKNNFNIYNDQQKKIGLIINKVLITESSTLECIAYLRNDIITNNQVYTASGQKFTIHPLPYKVDFKSELNS